VPAAPDDSEAQQTSATNPPVPLEKMLRIGMVCPYSLTIPGGVQSQVLGLARSVRAKGHEVRVLGPCDGPPPDPFVTPVGNSLPTAANGSVAPLAPDVSAALRTARALNDEAFDVIHVHEPYAPGPSLTAVLLKLAPIIATFHSAGYTSSYRAWGKTMKIIAPRIDIRTAVSQDAVELAQKYVGGDYEVLFNGIEVDRYRPLESHVVENKRENAIFFIGRHESRKGLAVLLQAMKKLPSDVSLWIGSDGPETEALKEQYKGDSRIEWIGRISDEEKIDRLHRAGVFCAPSLHGESFGVVLLEAMAAHAPVVASNLDGYRNVATHDVNALLVEPGDVDALASALARILVDSRLRQRLVEAGATHAESYSMDSLADRYIEIYRRLLRMDIDNIAKFAMPRPFRKLNKRLLRRSQVD
jgi:phosphatidylinositol alpha-mannosyltransferase